MLQSSPEDLQRVIHEQNPWWRHGKVPGPLAPPVERPLAQLLWRRLLEDDPRRYQLILGPRRVGKTTVLYQTVAHLLDKGVDSSRIWWFRLDHPILLREELGDLLLFAVESSGATPDRPVYLMLDELVYADSWDTWLKSFYDDQWPVKIAATSSAAAALHKGRVESGVGRWEEQHLTPYSLTEYLDLAAVQRQIVDAGDYIGWESLARETLASCIRAMPAGLSKFSVFSDDRRRLMLTGGFPELLDFATEGSDEGHAYSEGDLSLISQQVLRPVAVERAVYKDIPQSFGVGNPMMLERLLYVLADQVTGLLSPTNICSDLGIATPTFDRYLSYLEQAFMVFTLPNYSASEAKVQRRGRKLYFIDGAVRNAALQRGLAPIDDSAEMGVLLENLVAASLRTLSAHNGVRLYHWRHGDREVDLIYDDPQNPLAFEIASSPRHGRGGLEYFAGGNKRFRGNCYLVAPDAQVNHPRPDSTHAGTLPLDDLLIAIGAQAHQAMTRRLGVRYLTRHPRS